MKIYKQNIRIRFGHCDPAGIVYHPQYFVILNQLMEDFYRDVAGVGFIEVKKYGLGFPVAGVRCDFAAWVTYARRAFGSKSSAKRRFGLRSRFTRVTSSDCNARKPVFA